MSTFDREVLPLHGPLEEREDRVPEFLSVIGEVILHPRRDLGEGFPPDKSLFLQDYKCIRQRLGADPVEFLHQFAEPDPGRIAEDMDD